MSTPDPSTGRSESSGPSRWQRWAPVGLLVLIVLAALPAKFLQSYAQYEWSVDGGYYTTLAENIRDGLGFRTNISLYHKGYTEFPHPSSVYPLWPLLYGHLARFFPIEAVAVWVPTLFYFASLVLAYLWGTRVYPQPLGTTWSPVRAGHVMALLFAVNDEYFKFTSLPYTEGMGYALLFAAMLRFHTVLGRPSVRGGLELGVWMGVLILTRSQFVLVPLALICACGWGMIATPKRVAHAKLLAVALAVTALFLIPHMLWVRTFIPNAGLDVLLRFDQARADESLSRFNLIAQVDGLWPYLVDRAQGFLVAFRYTHKYAYRKIFYAFTWGLLFAAPIAMVSAAWWLSSRKRLEQGVAWLRSSHCVPALFVFAFVVGGFFSIHAVHKVYYTEWNFARRQALTAVWIFAWALVFMMRHGLAPVRVLGFTILVAGASQGYSRIHWRAQRTATKSATRTEPPFERRTKLATWLQAERARSSKPMIIAISNQEGQRMGPQLRGIGVHWVHAQTTLADLEYMVESLGLTHLVLGRKADRYAFKRHPKFRQRFRVLKRGLNAHTIWVPIEDPGAEQGATPEPVGSGGEQAPTKVRTTLSKPGIGPLPGPDPAMGGASDDDDEDDEDEDDGE